VRRPLLICGIFSSLLYTAANIIVPTRFAGYSVISQTVSELSAVNAPTRMLWLALMVLYTILLAAFGWGIRLSAKGRRSLQIAGILTIVHAVIGLFWPPMHLRGEAFTLTDTLHIAWTLITVPLMILQIAFAAAALGRPFQIYSAVTLVILVLFGILTGLDGPNIAANLPTPYVGIWERISIAAYMIWVIAFAAVLLCEDQELAR
jgi:hypothetical protein